MDTDLEDGWVGVFLKSEENLRAKSGPAIAFTLALDNVINPWKTARKPETRHKFNQREDDWGYRRLIEKKDLQESLAEFAPDNQFHVTVAMTRTDAQATDSSNSSASEPCATSTRAHGHTSTSEGPSETKHSNRVMICVREDAATLRQACPSTSPNASAFASQAQQCLGVLARHMPQGFKAGLWFEAGQVTASVKVSRTLMGNIPLLNDTLSNTRPETADAGCSPRGPDGAQVVQSSTHLVEDSTQAVEDSTQAVEDSSEEGFSRAYDYYTSEIQPARNHGASASHPTDSDIENATENMEHVTLRERETSLELPASIWGLVHALLLQEGGATPDALFGDVESQPFLVTETLLMADFLGCESVHSDIVTWLAHTARRCALLTSKEQDTHIDDLEFNEGGIDALVDHKLMYFSNVLHCVPSHFLDEMYGKLYDGFAVKDAVKLPHELLRGWLRQFSWIDLQGADLTAEQITQLLSCLSNRSVNVLHLQLPHLADPEEAEKSTTQVLDALECNAAQGMNLRVLSLHQISLSASHCVILSSVFHHVAMTLSGLRIDFHQAFLRKIRPPSNAQKANVKQLLFKAISRLNNLQTLCMPQWRQFVGRDLKAPGPLKGLISLQQVIVAHDDELKSPGLGNSLPFKTL